MTHSAVSDTDKISRDRGAITTLDSPPEPRFELAHDAAEDIRLNTLSLRCKAMKKTYSGSFAPAACVMAVVRNCERSADSPSGYSYPSCLTIGTKSFWKEQSIVAVAPR